MPCKLFAMSLYMTQWRKSKKNQVELTYFIQMNRNELRRSMEISKPKNKHLKYYFVKRLMVA